MTKHTKTKKSSTLQLQWILFTICAAYSCWLLLGTLSWSVPPSPLLKLLVVIVTAIMYPPLRLLMDKKTKGKASIVIMCVLLLIPVVVMTLLTQNPEIFA